MYRVLARKYRPQTFADLIGQEVLVRTLTNAFASGRIAHAFILTGIRGIGKTTTARIIARQMTSDQEAMIRSITLSVSGIHAIPRDLLSLQWIAYTTQVASNDADKSAVGRFSPLRKVRVVGKHLVEYELLALNPSKREVPYNCTFIGLENCVVGIVAKDGETTSVIVIDAPVPDVEYYFGAGYVTYVAGGTIDQLSGGRNYCVAEELQRLSSRRTKKVQPVVRQS